MSALSLSRSTNPPSTSTCVCVAAFYHFTDLPHYAELRAPLLERMLSWGIKGTVILASEGVNATISGSDADVEALLSWVAQACGVASMPAKFARTNDNPFYRTKVKLKKEIVTMGIESTALCPGVYVRPRQWNAFIQRSDVLLVDTRNDYEYAIGTFIGAVNPQLDTFRQFPHYLEKQIKPLMEEKGITKLAMFCTGGIRCEKASSLAKHLGMDAHHLQGGILAYLEQIPQQHSLWQGECFVFDNRVAVGHGLEQGTFDQCYACRYPVSVDDRQDPRFVPGESCPRCFGTRTPYQRQRASERNKQIRLAKKRGYKHLAAAPPSKAR